MQRDWHDSILSSLVDQMAPPVTRNISLKPPNPLMTSAILSSKTQCRYVEYIWLNKTGLLSPARHTYATDWWLMQNLLNMLEVLLRTLVIIGYYGRI